MDSPALVLAEKECELNVPFVSVRLRPIELELFVPSVTVSPIFFATDSLKPSVMLLETPSLVLSEKLICRSARGLSPEDNSS